MIAESACLGDSSYVAKCQGVVGGTGGRPRFAGVRGLPCVTIAQRSA